MRTATTNAFLRERDRRAVNLGAHWSVKDFGIVGYGLLTYRHFGTFVDRYLRRSDFLGVALLFDSVVDHENWYLVMTPREPLRDEALKRCIEEACAQIFPVYQELTGQSFRPVRVEIALPRHPNEKFLGSSLHNVPVVFDAPAHRLVMRRHDRDRHIDIAEKDLIDLCRKCCQKILPAAVDRPFPLPQVRERLLLSCGEPEQVGEIADWLGLSKRSLNRHLAKLGWTHTQLVNQYRRDYAFELLRTKQFCIKEVAFMVGFDRAGCLQRAFRQWTGVSVGQWARTYCEKDVEQLQLRTSQKIFPERSAVSVLDLAKTRNPQLH